MVDLFAYIILGIVVAFGAAIAAVGIIISIFILGYLILGVYMALAGLFKKV